jgi:hypothetical protein
MSNSGTTHDVTAVQHSRSHATMWLFPTTMEVCSTHFQSIQRPNLRNTDRAGNSPFPRPPKGLTQPRDLYASFSTTNVHEEILFCIYFAWWNCRRNTSACLPSVNTKANRSNDIRVSVRSSITWPHVSAGIRSRHQASK